MKKLILASVAATMAAGTLSAAEVSCRMSEGRKIDSNTGAWVTELESKTLTEIFTDRDTWLSTVTFELDDELVMNLDKGRPFKKLDKKGREIYLNGGKYGVSSSYVTFNNDIMTVYRGSCSTKYR